MSNSSPSTFVLAKDNPIDKNNEQTTKIHDNTHNADFAARDLRLPGVDLNYKTASDKTCMPCGHKLNARNLIVCIDGASNQFGDKNTNIMELYNLLSKKVEDNQRTWYNSGIGTYAQPCWKSFNYYKRVLYHKIDSAISWDFEPTILAAYRWLSDNYENDDCIFLFGFSRGAFQVRVLSAMIEKVGLIYKGNEMQIPFAYELYVDPRSAWRPKTFSHEKATVHFVGAWDTVSSEKSILPGTVEGMTHVCYFRHALALDEQRVKFLPLYAYGGSAKPLNPIPNTRGTESNGRLLKTKEVWFAGTHSDVGGGNLRNQDMNRTVSPPPLRWMVFEAGATGLRTELFKHGPRDYQDINIIKSTMIWPWVLFELCPLKRLTFTRKEDGLQGTTRMPHLGQSRKIHRGQKIHSSLVRAARSTADSYKPKAKPFNANPSFWEILRDGEKESTAYISEWLELDLYEQSKRAAEKLVDGDDTALKSLHDIFILGEVRQVVYSIVIHALHEKELTLARKDLLLRTTMDLFKNSRNDFHFKLSPLREIQPLLSDLLCHSDNAEYRRTAWDFVTIFTDFVTVIQSPKVLTSCTMSRDGTSIIARCRDRTVQIWDVETGNSVGEQSPGHDDWVRSVAFSPDGRRIIFGSDDGTVRIWAAETGSLVGEPFHGHHRCARSVVFSPNGKRIVFGSRDSTLRIWDAETGSSVGEPLRGHHDSVLCVAFSPDGTRIISGSRDSTVRIWDADTCSLVGEPLRGHHDCVWSVAFSPDGTRIVSGSSDRTVRIWDAETCSLVGEPLRGHNDCVWSVAFSPDGNRIISVSQDDSVRVWDMKALGMLNATTSGKKVVAT
ncbi:hypothetical protein K443DRAFT_351189 [Laccaria amethystina LaAM-08-1]|uniref:T6SS Phospholipase effector Tle1-like catalytic domain-containing protein n=1 Tax=Laccaria amethystina LaAM-08-1 TaxID=1095629 RepID=A0A0C9WJH2_9AGAR|nr:hypothetical protein K443DRAFT_351189 [Laccaria amethystina LaAM-08-1]